MNDDSQATTENRGIRPIYIIALLLFLLTAGSSVYFWRKSNNASAENARLMDEVQALEIEKAMIERQLDSLGRAYSDLRTENEDLSGKVASSSELIAQKDAAILKLKTQSSRELKELRKQVEELRRLKIEYETLIAALQQENAQLKEENAQLQGENRQLRDENADLSGQVDDLAQKLEDQIRKTQSAKFKASAFKVELGRRSGKQTIRASKARDITVSFDLIDVPKPYQGDQHLYLVITDDKGTAIKSDKPIKTTVDAPAGPIQITAQQVKPVSLTEAQRLTFSYKLDEKLKRGNYVAAIYCNVGLLGASSFRLN
jgi:predicted  nucleic acid-binding Zn-ribbon protein